MFRQWIDVLCLIEDEDTNNLIGSDDHSLVLALGMAVGYPRKNTTCFTREAIKERQTPVVSKTEPDDVIDEDRDAARLELACVWG